jgi:hypothetical protein
MDSIMLRDQFLAPNTDPLFIRQYLVGPTCDQMEPLWMHALDMGVWQDNLFVDPDYNLPLVGILSDMRILDPNYWIGENTLSKGTVIVKNPNRSGRLCETYGVKNGILEYGEFLYACIVNDGDWEIRRPVVAEYQRSLRKLLADKNMVNLHE